jgi:hypothetical protein
MNWITFASVMIPIAGMIWLMHRENVKMYLDATKSNALEMKDFHGRLCVLEEKYIQMMQRYWESK